MGVGVGSGVGVGVGVGSGVGVGVGSGVGVGVGVGSGVSEGLGVGSGVLLTLGVGVGAGVSGPQAASPRVKVKHKNVALSFFMVSSFLVKLSGFKKLKHLYCDIS